MLGNGRPFCKVALVRTEEWVNADDKGRRRSLRGRPRARSVRKAEWKVEGEFSMEGREKLQL